MKTLPNLLLLGCAIMLFSFLPQISLARTNDHSAEYNIGDALILTVTCPPDITLSCNAPVPPADPNSVSASSPGCGITSITWTGDVTTTGICPQEAIITRTYHVIDGCLNSADCTQTITIIDNTPPVITCSNQTTPIGCPGVPVFTPPTAIDACDINVTVTFTDAVTGGICPGTYSITRTWTAIDDCANMSSCSRTIVVQDITPPTVTCPPNITISCNDSTSPGFTGDATAFDACDALVIITHSDVIIPGQCVYSVINRTFTATDDCGNIGTCILVISIEDIDPPIIICPPSVTISCSSNTSPSNTGIASSFDNCDQNPVMNVLDNYIPGSCTNSGTLQRTFIAIDDCGNSSSCIQIISVVDNIPPVISNGPVDITVTASGPSPCSMFVSIGIPTAIDNCDPTVMLSNDYNLTGDASDIYPEGSTLVIFTATDECGNTSTHSFMVLVNCQPPGPCGIVVHSDCNVEISGYTRLGEASGGAPYIKMKELPITTTGGNHNSTVSIPHGLTASKIISVSVLVESTTDNFIPPEYSTAINLRYSFSVSPTDIVIQNNTLVGDCVICSKPAKVLIIYKE